MGCDLVVVVMKGLGMVMKLERFFQNVASILFHALLTNENFPYIIGLTNSCLGKVKVKVTQSCLTLCEPMDYTVHGILQARVVEWVAVPFFRGSSQPRDQTQVSCIAVDSLPAVPPGKILPGLDRVENILLGGRGSLPPSAVNYFPSSSCSSRPS